MDLCCCGAGECAFCDLGQACVYCLDEFVVGWGCVAIYVECCAKVFGVGGLPGVVVGVRGGAYLRGDGGFYWALSFKVPCKAGEGWDWYVWWCIVYVDIALITFPT